MSNRSWLRTSFLVSTLLVVAATLGAGRTRAAEADLALGKPMLASSSVIGHAPDLAVDGDLGTFWASKKEAAQWIYVDLLNTYALSEFRMQWTLGRHAQSYAVFVRHQQCGWCPIARTMNGDGDDTLIRTTPVTARYVLLAVSDPAATNGGYQLRDWQVFGAPSVPPPGETNIALGKPAIASSAEAGSEALSATDGEGATMWRSQRLPAWLYVDFGSPATLRNTVLRWAVEDRASHYGLYGWSSGGWRPLYATSLGDGGDDHIRLPSVQTRYLLLFGTAGPSGRLGLIELEAYGTTAGAPLSPEEGVTGTFEGLLSGDRAADVNEFPALPSFGDHVDGEKWLEGSPVQEWPEVDAPPTEGLPDPS
jgi:hypothetical protein